MINQYLTDILSVTNSKQSALIMRINQSNQSRRFANCARSESCGPDEEAAGGGSGRRGGMGGGRGEGTVTGI